MTYNLHDLIAFQSIGAVGSDVSEMYEATSSDLASKAKSRDEHEIGNSYCFFSSRGNEIALTVIAGSYSTKRQQTTVTK